MKLYRQTDRLGSYAAASSPIEELMKHSTKLDDLIAESLYPVISSANDYDGRSEGAEGKIGALSIKNGVTVVDKYIDVHEEEGCITIPCKELPDSWNKESDMLRFKTLDRPFVFPGEQIQIIACLSACKQEEYKRQTEELLKRFKNSHFFTRIAESDEALWSRRKTHETNGGKFIPIESCNDDVAVDRGILDASTSGGIAKNDVKCSQLANGDIVVLLKVNICVDFLKNPILEILQFEKYENSGQSEHDPYGDLLNWILPVQNSHFLPPQEKGPSSSARSSFTKPKPKPNPKPNSFGSQNFLLGQFRSHSMSSISSKNVYPSTFSSDEGLLSFRGVPLEPERFSVCCGLEGIYIPGRRWRRKIEIIQPLEICCFASDCNTKDLLCVQIKNVSPPHTPDIVIYLDSITLVFEEASKGGAPISLPIACVETGNDHGLPDLPLRKGEEHSFILKPATPLWSSNAGSAGSSVRIFTNVYRGILPTDKYAVLVSCRCNYTESRLLFKQPANWRPHIQKDILISVASQMSKRTLGPDDKYLPVQVLTLEASNMTNEDLTLTLLAPSLLNSPSVASLTLSPPTPMSPFDNNLQNSALHRLRSASKVLDQRSGEGDDHGHTSGIFNEKTVPISDALPRSNLGRTHMWLKSRVPLGCVPSRSTVTVKLELLPLTDGIITLDSLQINVEKGLSYIPENPLKIRNF
ncbi:hypothetical protein L1987_57623 [Smallanthus sonchifolius]|uniref:Uncharacterized protein n=1 Tax=Smallanthus sonchifolius TaxID=185202 RepID=A0ACB9DDD5_9ASTR|nr:hypothetical protein L1987_57623 [Smallanthus sonchifolius]